MNAFNPRKPREYDWDNEPTPSLNLFLTAEKTHTNLWWEIESGHQRNLFEEALQRLAQAEGLADSVRSLRDELARESNHPERGRQTNIETRRIASRLSKAIHRWGTA